MLRPSLRTDLCAHRSLAFPTPRVRHSSRVCFVAAAIQDCTLSSTLPTGTAGTAIFPSPTSRSRKDHDSLPESDAPPGPADGPRPTNHLIRHEPSSLPQRLFCLGGCEARFADSYTAGAASAQRLHQLLNRRVRYHLPSALTARKSTAAHDSNGGTSFFPAVCGPHYLPACIPLPSSANLYDLVACQELEIKNPCCADCVP